MKRTRSSVRLLTPPPKRRRMARACAALSALSNSYRKKGNACILTI